MRNSFPEHRALRGKNGVSDDDNDAVVNVSYHDALEFCKKLGQRESRIYRLPTEAEWVRMPRRHIYVYNTGDWFPDSLPEVAACARDFDPVSLRVGQFAPNAFGLYDMHGNVEGVWTTTGHIPQTKRPTHADRRRRIPGNARWSHHTPVKYLAKRQPKRHAPRRPPFPDRIPHSGVGRRASALRRKMEVPAVRRDISAGNPYGTFRQTPHCTCRRYRLSSLRNVAAACPFTATTTSRR